MLLNIINKDKYVMLSVAKHLIQSKGDASSQAPQHDVLIGVM
jgi:hypothetical protein